MAPRSPRSARAGSPAAAAAPRPRTTSAAMHRASGTSRQGSSSPARTPAGGAPVQHPVQVGDDSDEGHRQESQHEPHEPRPPEREAGPEQRELRHEEAEGWQPDQRQPARQEQPAGPRHRLEQTRHARDLGRLVAVEHPSGEEEHRGLRQRVVHQVQHRGDGPQRSQRQPHADQAHVLDARVGQHPLVVPLDHEAEGRDRERQDTRGGRGAGSGRRVPTAALTTAFQRMIAYSATASSTPDIMAESGAGASAWASGSHVCIGARPGLRPVAHQDEHERQLHDLGVERRRGGPQHGPVQDRLLRTRQAHEVEIRRARCRRTPARCRPTRAARTSTRPRRTPW